MNRHIPHLEIVGIFDLQDKRAYPLLLWKGRINMNIPNIDQVLLLRALSGGYSHYTHLAGYYFLFLPHYSPRPVAVFVENNS